jgi:hypothetical protein
MIIRSTLRLAAAALLVAATACAPGDGDAAPGTAGAAPASEQSTEPAAAADTTVVAGTPEGGLERWIGEIRAGVDSLGDLAERDAAAAKNVALNLYVTRQEFIELYYGTTARAAKDAVLNEAVMTAEARFHDLLRVVNTPDGAIDTRLLRESAGAMDAQYDRVLARARELELDLSRPVAPGGAS